MKTLFICFLIFSTVMLKQNIQVGGRILFENLQKNAKENLPPSNAKDQVNSYNRGCSHITRCRGNDD
jgi:hypothetical protein